MYIRKQKCHTLQSQTIKTKEKKTVLFVCLYYLKITFQKRSVVINNGPNGDCLGCFHQASKITYCRFRFYVPLQVLHTKH